MAKFDKINKLQIGNHVWHFTSPQIIEWESDGESVTMRAVLRIQHEEHLTKAASDASQRCAHGILVVNVTSKHASLANPRR